MKQTIKESQLRQLIREEVRKILREAEENPLLNQTITNPVNNKKIKVSSALSYDKDHPAYKLAQTVLKRGHKPTGEEKKQDKMEKSSIRNQIKDLHDRLLISDNPERSKKLQAQIDALEDKL